MSKKKAHFLVVDDNRMDIELTLNAFREFRLHNTVHVATSGMMALDYVFGRGAYADRQKYLMPDLILLDLKMPGMDGHEVLRQLKSTPVIRRLPVVVLTSSQEDGDRALSYDYGANSYLVKPVSFDGFMEVIQTLDSYWRGLNVGPPM